MLGETLELPVGPDGIRVFLGYRAPDLVEKPDDDETERTRKRTQFMTDVGQTFMPGTPLMQAPLGLAAYLPAVIDPPAGDPVPDEVAIIVYASRKVYDQFRETSLSRRMYTKSHVAVFDMPKSVAHFPGLAAAPASRSVNGEDYLFGYRSEDRVDWQAGSTRIVIAVPIAQSPGFATAAMRRLASADHLDRAGVDQVVAGAGPGFAAYWIHSAQPTELDLAALLPEGARVYRELVATPAPVAGDHERGVKIDGPSAFTFRFSRDMRFFDDRPTQAA